MKPRTSRITRRAFVRDASGLVVGFSVNVYLGVAYGLTLAVAALPLGTPVEVEAIAELAS